ncbi:MAG: CPBP family intramembrane metalloprotease [Victivallaceae bacterium]|nr:CPBP family intramembrane metalloprotease [Victivallaceae bacterium]
MLILQKNSFNKKDEITNIGFAISLSLLVLVFLLIPIIFALLAIKNISPVIHVLLPSVIIIPSLCIAMYFVGKPGNLLKKLKLVDLHPDHISISFVSSILLLFVMANFMYIYHKLLTMMGIKVDPPMIEAILKNSDSSSLWWMCLGIIVLAPISEELIFRRFIFGFLAPRCGFLTAMVVTAWLFAAIHLSLYSLPALFLLGIGFQLIYLKFGSIYPAILMHAFNNAIAVTLLLLLPQAQT